MEGEDEIQQLCKVTLLVLTSLSYCYFIASNIPTGKSRLLSLLPVLYLFTALPPLFSCLFPNAIATLLLTWLSNFKLLLFAFGQGPLSHSNSLFQFISVASLPIKLNQNEKHPSPPNLPLSCPSKLLLFALLIAVQDYKQHLLPQLLLASYCCLAYLLIDIIFGACNTVVHAAFKMELEPPSNEPYLATSLQDFWGRRWNLMVTHLLRHTVYRPVKSYLDDVMGPWASLPAVLATFLVSGLMHELLFYRVTLVSPSWEVTCFFVLQGVCLAVESAVKRVLAGRLRLHPAVAGPLTVGFVMVTTNWLFFPPLLRAGADGKAIEECKMLIRVCKEGLKAGFRRFETLDTWTMIS